MKNKLLLFLYYIRDILSLIKNLILFLLIEKNLNINILLYLNKLLFEKRLIFFHFFLSKILIIKLSKKKFDSNFSFYLFLKYTKYEVKKKTILYWLIHRYYVLYSEINKGLTYREKFLKHIILNKQNPYLNDLANKELYTYTHQEKQRKTSGTFSNKVLILGPLYESSSKNLNLKEFNTLVLINPRKKDLNLIKNLNIKKIAYFATGRLKKELKEIESIICDFDICCFKRKEVFVKISEKKYFQKINTKFELLIFDQNMGINDYGFNFLQIAISDLLSKGFEQIYLSGFTLYSSKIVYPKNYFEDREKNLISLSLRTHDPISNFIFIKYFYLKGKINTIDKVDKILSLSVKDYCTKINNLYHHSNQINIFKQIYKRKNKIN